MYRQYAQLENVQNDLTKIVRSFIVGYIYVYVHVHVHAHVHIFVYVYLYADSTVLTEWLKLTIYITSILWQTISLAIVDKRWRIIKCILWRSPHEFNLIRYVRSK